MKITMGSKSLVKLGKLGIGLLVLVLVSYFFVQFIIPTFSAPLNAAQTYVNTSIYPNTLSKNGTAQQFNFTVTLTNNPANVSAFNFTILIPASGSAFNFTVGSGSNVTNSSGSWTGIFLGNSTPTTPVAVMFNTTSTAGLTGNTSIVVGFTATPNSSLTTDNATQTWNITVGDNSTVTVYTSQFVYTFVDSQSPRITNTVPGNTTYIAGTASQLFNMTVADTNLNLTNASLHFKVGSGEWNNTFASNATGLTCAGTSPNFACSGTVDLQAAGVIDGSIISYFFEASDNLTNYNSNGTLTSPLTATVDTNPPVLGNNTPLTANGTQYSPGKSYVFNVTASDALSGVSQVLFEFNTTNSSGAYNSSVANNTATLVSGTTNNYSFTATDLPSGLFVFKWYANDSVQPSSDSNWANTSQVVFNVSVNQSNPVNIFLNTTQNANNSYTYPAASAAVVQAVYSSTGNVNLFRDGVQKASGSSPQSENVSLANGTFAYQANASGNANYTANATGITFYALVNKGATTVTLLLNATSNANFTASSNAQVNATTTVDNSQGNISLYRNNALINSSITATTIQNTTGYTGLPGSTNNITAFYATTQNYSSASQTFFIIIESGVPTFSSQASNITNASTIGKFGNGTILISAQWNDAYTLNNYWFSNNTSSSFTNDSAVAFAAGNWTNITFNPNIVNITGGNAVVQMKIYGNDTSGNQNSTQTFQFTVNGVAPSITSPSPANNSYIAGSSTQNFSITVTDPVLNTSNVTLYYRTSGQSIWPNNRSLVCVGPSPYFCSNLTDLSLLADNTTVQYLFTASDGSQLSGTSGSFAQPYNITIDKQSPYYTANAATNVTVIGKNDGVNVSAQWTDNQNLSFAVLETNESGTAANKTGFYGSPFAFAGGTGPTTVSFNWTNSSVATGVVVSFRIFANDTLGNSNVTTYINVTMSGNSPQITANSTNTTNSTTIAKGTQINVSATWNDALRLDKWWVLLGTTGNNSLTNTSATAFTATNVSNYTIDTSQFSTGSTINATIFANNTAGLQNSTANSRMFLQWTIDGTPPQFSANTSAAVGTYSSALSNFTVTWTDNVGMSLGFIEQNFTGSLANTTLTNSSSAYSFNLTLPAGTFQYRYLANDTSNNFNATPIFTFTVLKGNVSLNLTLNATNGNNTYTYPNAVNSSAFINSTVNSEGNLSFYRNGVIVASASPVATVAENTVLGNGSANYTAVFTATNYSTNSISNVYAIVNAGVMNITLMLNGTAANSTYTYPAAINATGNMSSIFSQSTYNITLLRDGVAKASSTSGTAISENILLGNGTYNYTLTWSSGNYTVNNVTTTGFAFVNKGNASVTVNPGNLTVTYGNATIPYCSSTVTTEKCTLWRNTTAGYSNVTAVENGTSVTYNAVGHSFRANITDTQNYSDFQADSVLTVNKGNVTLDMYFNGTANSNSAVTYPSGINATGVINISDSNQNSFTLYQNGTSVGSQSGQKIEYNAATSATSYNYTAFYAGNANYSSQTTSYNFTINKGNTSVLLWINNTQANNTMPQGSPLNITTTINTTYNVPLNIETNINDGWVNQSTTGVRLENTSSTSTYGVANNYNVTASFAGDQNFTAGRQTWSLNITQDLTGPTVKLFDVGLNAYNFNNTTARKSGATINLNISVSDAGIGVTSGQMCFAKLGTATGQNFANYSSGWCNGTFSVPSLSNGPQLFNITVNDTNNNTGFNDTFYITVDNTAPLLTITIPTANGTYVKSDSNGYIWINGTVSDNLQMGLGNVSINGTYFNNSATTAAPYSFTGANNSVFAYRNTSAIPDGYYLFVVNHTDNATNTGQVYTTFYVDNTPPSAVYGLTNSSSQNYATSTSQTVQVRVDDALQTNGTITLHYYLNGTWLTASLTGIPSTSTTYSGSISTMHNDSLVANGVSYMTYYISGVDNATNSITNGGSSSSPLANLTFGTTGAIDGYVLQNVTSTPITGATVSDGTRAAVTNSNGYYIISSVPAGSYTVTATATNYTSNSTSSVSVTAGATTRANVTMAYTANGIIQGYVKVNGTSTVLAGATVSDGTRAAITNNAGFYQISNVPAGSYTVTANLTNYASNSTSATVTAGATTEANITMATNANGIIQGYVYLTNTSIVPNGTSTITVSDGTRTVNPNTAGLYQITGVPAGSYTLTVSGVGYWTNSSSVTVTAGATTSQSMTVNGAENFNVTIPGTAGSSNTGFYDTGWHQFFLSTQVFAAGTSNYTIANLFSPVNGNYTIIYRFNTSLGWTSYVPGAGGNDLTTVNSTSDQYYINMNATDRVELERRY